MLGIKTIPHTHQLGQIPIAHIVDVVATCSVLAAGKIGPATMHRARVVKRGSCRPMYFVGLSIDKYFYNR